MQNWNEEKLRIFCEDNFLEDDIGNKLKLFMNGQEGTIELIPKEGDEQQHASLKIDILLS